jgi:hypothetical protein
MDEADPRAKLEPFQALICEWTIEMTHPMVEDTVIRGRATYEWLEGGRFLIQPSVNEHPDFSDSLCVIGLRRARTTSRCSTSTCAASIEPTPSGSTAES